MKEITRFKVGDVIPTNANFLCSEPQKMGIALVYEVPVKKEPTENSIEKDKKINETIERVISYLNKKTNGKYRSSSNANVKLIKARLKEGFEPEDFKSVIDNMCSAWEDDEAMNRFLRPSTLFGNKFGGYLRVNDSKSDRDKAFEALDELNKKVLKDEEGTI